MLSFVAQRLKAATPFRWPEALLAAYTFSFFLPNITRYKGLILILLLGTAVAMLWRGQASLASLWRQTPLRALLLLAVAVLYGCLVSPDPVLSLRDANRPILIDCLLVGLLWPLVLQRSTAERIALAMIGGFVAGLAVLLGLDAYRYYVDFTRHGVAFGAGYDHRELSYPLLVTVPFALAGLRRGATAVRSACFLLLLLATISLIGTLARGAWLAAVVVGGVWVVYYRVWRQAALLALFAAIVAGVWLVRYPDSNLAFKLHQTDSSQRWGGGVQSAAVDLVLENPWRGYGFGDEIYAGVYNSRVTAHPEWIVRQSMGPHNMTLRMWFAGGVLGLVAILGLYLAVVAASLRALRDCSGIAHDAAFAILLAFIGAVFVRGLFESAYMNYFGWIIGTLVALSFPRGDNAAIPGRPLDGAASS